MKRITSVHLKAALLFVVFASNTTLGFACAIGINMDLIQHIIHHNKAEEATECSAHIHANGKIHHHHENKDQEKDDNCCNKKVVSFEQLDKIISHPVTVNFVLPIFELFPLLLLNTSIHPGTSSIVHNYTFRNFHLPPEDIRVSIRSFQI